ncbi:MAG: pilus assembly PilX N-terminal domain-containing protein [Nitrospira sp.]|nr:pilus assembly PilX N-terminal domain-containing protein [Nitrospira sp.]
MSCRNVGGDQRGIALLGAMVIVLILSVLATTLLNLSGQEAISASAAGQLAVAQQLADASADLVVGWFHDPQLTSTVPAIVSLRAKRNHDADGAPSFFDATGRSQFVGTMEHPDLRLQAETDSDDRLLNDPDIGMFRAMQHLGRVEELKVYAPTDPGLLCTVDTTVVTKTTPSVRQSVRMQLRALGLPALKAAVQVRRHLGQSHPGGESPVTLHWGDLKVGGDLVLKQATDLPRKSDIAPVTGQGYGEIGQREDRWMEAWVGGDIQLTRPPAQPITDVPANLHIGQNPIPGVRFDEWPYEHLKRMAKRFGRYFAIDREGFLYPQGIIEPGRGVSPDEVFKFQTPGDQQGLVFIDTLDQTAPRADNLGVLKLQAPYFEGTMVVQGHVVLAPNGSGSSIRVLSPPKTDQGNDPIRMPIELSGMHFNGVLYASGHITVAGGVRLYGAVMAGETIASSDSGSSLEVWYDHDLGQGLFRGLPVVYRAPGTWMARY